jgi:Ni,Fe-hydrogenase III component G
MEGENKRNRVEIHVLNRIRDDIEMMSKFNQVEVLRILSKHSDVTLNENKYGVHINLTELSTERIEDLMQFIHYVNHQEQSLGFLEQQKETFKTTYFAKQVKETAGKKERICALDE